MLQDQWPCCGLELTFDLWWARRKRNERMWWSYNTSRNTILDQQTEHEGKCWTRFKPCSWHGSVGPDWNITITIGCIAIKKIVHTLPKDKMCWLCCVFDFSLRTIIKVNIFGFSVISFYCFHVERRWQFFGQHEQHNMLSYNIYRMDIHGSQRMMPNWFYWSIYFFI